MKKVCEDIIGPIEVKYGRTTKLLIAAKMWSNNDRGVKN